MAKKTTVDLTEFVIPIKDSLIDVFGLRNILSAGLIVLNNLTDEDINKSVAEANGKFGRLNFYEDRIKLIKVREIISSCESQDGGAEIDRDTRKKIFETIGMPQQPLKSSWYVELSSSKTQNRPDIKSETYRQSTKKLLESVRVQLTPGQMDAFVRALGYDPKQKKDAG